MMHAHHSTRSPLNRNCRRRGPGRPRRRHAPRRQGLRRDGARPARHARRPRLPRSMPAVTGSTSGRPSSPCLRSSATSGPPAAATSTPMSTFAPLDPFYEIRWPDGVAFHRARLHRSDGRGGPPPLARRCQRLPAVPEGRATPLRRRLRGHGRRTHCTGSGAPRRSSPSSPASAPTGRYSGSPAPG